MAADGHASGLKQALAIVGAIGGVVDDEGRQVDLFENDEAPLPLPAKGVSGPKGGRPKNARNKSTEETVRWFLSQHRSPLSVMANIYGQPTAELFQALQAMADQHAKVKIGEDGIERVVGAMRVDPVAVLKLQLAAAQAVAPYIHKQQPKAIEIEQRPRGVVVLGDFEDGEIMGDDDALPVPASAVPCGVPGAVPPVPMAAQQSVQNQRVAERAAPQSDALEVGQAEFASDDNPLVFRDT